MKETVKYIAITIAAVVSAFLLHEFTHWLTGTALGYEMRMSLNHAYPAGGRYLAGWHYTLISATGPLITLIQSFLFFIIIKKNHQRLLYPFLCAGCYLEFLSGVMNFRHANDLGRISDNFGIGLFTIPVIFVALHFYFLYQTSRRENYSTRFIAWTFFLILLVSSVWILLNNKYEIVLL